MKKRLLWNTCFARKVVKESEYYEEMMRYLQKNLALFPYHLAEYVCRVMRVSPFRYYCDMLFEVIRNVSLIGCSPSNSKECGIRYSLFTNQAGFCAAPKPTLWPGLLQIPDPHFRAVRIRFLPSDLPDASCRDTGSCPVSILITGTNKSLAQSVAENMLTTAPFNPSDLLASMSNNAVIRASLFFFFGGSAAVPSNNMVLDSAFIPHQVLYHVQQDCTNRRSCGKLTSQLQKKFYRRSQLIFLLNLGGQFVWLICPSKNLRNFQKKK